MLARAASAAAFASCFDLSIACCSVSSSLTTFRDGERRPTSLLVLTFNTPRLPLKLKTGYLCYDVKVFIPNPLRCFRCQRFGHGQNNCKQSPRCSKCGQTPHDGSDCSAPKKCVSCGSGEHTTTSRECPTWLKEKEICEVKVRRDISYGEARKLVEVSETPMKSYASVASKVTVSSGCQTDPLPQLPPLKLLAPVQPSRSAGQPVETKTHAQSHTQASGPFMVPSRASYAEIRSSPIMTIESQGYESPRQRARARSRPEQTQSAARPREGHSASGHRDHSRPPVKVAPGRARSISGNRDGFWEKAPSGASPPPS